MTAPVHPARIRAAQAFGLVNVDQAAVACRLAGLPFPVACALLEKESGGDNVYGHDLGGVFSRVTDRTVTAENFFRFIVSVMNGATSNGVGPCQITYAGSLHGGLRDGGYFRQMAVMKLRPWVPIDNMTFGFGLLAIHHGKHLAADKSWVTAGRLYNGALAYGIDLDAKVTVWRERLRKAERGQA